MPLIRLSIFKRRALLTTSISLNKKIISPYSYYIKKGLVCVIIINPSSHQFFFYTKCTKLNTCMLYNMRLISLNKYIFLYYAYCYTY